MEDNHIVDRLAQFGLTRQEATIYAAMSEQGEMTGYEAAKITGISRSNAYNALAGLVEKGAAYIIEGTATKYTAVAVTEFCENKIRRLGEMKEYLAANMTENKREPECYATIEGDRHILDKIRNMLDRTEQRIYLSMPVSLIELVAPELKRLIGRNIKVVILTDTEYALEGAKVYLGDKKESQVRLITDSSYALTGELGKGHQSTCLYASKQNFVDVLKEALRNEIKLIELTKGDF